MNHPNRYYTAKRIARMILRNVAAMEAGRITWAQFTAVQRATYDLVCPDGLPSWRRLRAVQLQIRALGA